MSILRLAKRSAIMPPQGPNSSDGMNCSATVMPTAVTEPDSSSTSQSWAIRCIQRAITATKWPIAKMRKLGTFSETNVCRQGRCSLTTAMGWVWADAAETDAEAESMTGWLTVADVGGGGATGMSSGKRAGWDASHARLVPHDYVALLCL